MNPDILDPIDLSTSDPTLLSFSTDANTAALGALDNTAGLPSSVSSSNGLGSIVQSIGADILGIVGINHGQPGVVNNGSYVPNSVLRTNAVTSSLSTTLIVVGAVVVIAAVAFRK